VTEWLIAIEAYLVRASDDISVSECSICKEQFHTSPVGPRKYVKEFAEHVRTDHPQAIIKLKHSAALSALRDS